MAGARKLGTRTEGYGDRGVFVPDGMTAAEIMLGAAAIESRFGLDHYEARSIVRVVLAALRADQPLEDKQG